MEIDVRITSRDTATLPVRSDPRARRAAAVRDSLYDDRTYRFYLITERRKWIFSVKIPTRDFGWESFNQARELIVQPRG